MLTFHHMLIKPIRHNIRTPRNRHTCPTIPAIIQLMFILKSHILRLRFINRPNAFLLPHLQNTPHISPRQNIPLQRTHHRLHHQFLTQTLKLGRAMPIFQGNEFREGCGASDLSTGDSGAASHLHPAILIILNSINDWIRIAADGELEDLARSFVSLSF